MDLSTNFMGLPVRNPLVLGASPLSGNVDRCRAFEDHGIAAIVMESLFMETLDRERAALFHPDATEPEGRGSDKVLEQLTRLKQALDVPVIASLNGTVNGPWVRQASQLERAGADGLELNVYYLALDGEESPEEVEGRCLSLLAAVKAAVAIPVAVKLSRHFSSPVHLARRIERAGADGLVLFAPLFHTDLDIERYEVVPSLHGSDAGDLGARLLWLAAMYGRVRLPLTLSGGAHTHVDVIKAVMSGASAVQMTTALLRYGPAHAGVVLEGLRAWLEEHDLASIDQLRGTMSLLQCADPQAFERANYIKVLQSWRR